MVITLDGYSACGKSTLSKILAKELNFNYLNTGMIYRAITAFLLQNNISFENIEKISQIIESLDVKVVFNNNVQKVLINNINFTNFINDKSVQQNVAIYSSILPIREKVKSIQEVIAKNSNIVVEGRDIGTHIFPNAEFKFFIICEIDIRAQRRLNDLLASGQMTTFDEVKKSLVERDLKDTTRKFGPLVKPDDAVVIDTSYSSIAECIKQMLFCINGQKN